MRSYYKGEKRTICVEVKRKKKTPFIIEKANYTVQDIDGKTVQQGIASIDSANVMFLLDTALGGYSHEKGRNKYQAWFEVFVADIGKVLLNPVMIVIKPGIK